MDKRIKKIFLSPQMKHIRKALHHLIMLERCISNNVVINSTYMVQTYTGGASPFEVIWSYKKSPIDLLPRLKHKLKIVHFDQSYQQLKQWNSVHLLNNENVDDTLPLNKYNSIEVTETSSSTKIQYGTYPLSCMLEISSQSGEHKSPMSIITFSIITVEEYKDQSYKGGKSDKTWSSSDLDTIEFNPTHYRNVIFYLFPYIENLIKARCNEEYIEPAYRDDFKEFLELLLQ